MIQRIHFHRTFLDELYYRQIGTKIKELLATLLSTYRYYVTVMPIGYSLDDLYEQLRFLCIPQFFYKEFWRLNVTDPCYGRSFGSLWVIRSLMSHLVVRYSKEQAIGDRKAILNLRSSFGYDAEKNVY